MHPLTHAGLFVTELGDGGAGPGYELSHLGTSCCTDRRPGHPARPSPYLPGPRYLDDWEQRYEDPPGPERVFLPGTLKVADSQKRAFSGAQNRTFSLS